MVQHPDGFILEAGMPQPKGTRVEARVIPVELEFRDFGECPICLSPNAVSREHVPPRAVGGSALTMTCEPCNNKFGSRFEARLQSWYENSYNKVRLFGGDTVGRRHAGDFLVRETPDGEFVLLQTGRADPAIDQILRSGQFTMECLVPNMTAVRIAAVKAAYLAACLMLGMVPRTARAAAVRAELIAARDHPRDYELGPALNSIALARTTVEPQPGKIALLEMPLPDGSINYAIGFNHVFAVDWPLDRITLERR